MGMTETAKNNGRTADGKFTKDNEYKWKPGHSGNPKGRRDAVSDIVRQMLDADNGKLKKELTEKLVAGSVKYEGDDFLKYFDRIKEWTEGKSTQTIDITTNERPEYDGDDPEGYLSDRLSQRQGS